MSRRIEAIWTDCRTRYGGGGAVPVRRLRRRRRHVRAGRLPLPHLRGRGRCRGPRLHGGGHGVAGLARMARGGDWPSPGCCRRTRWTGRPLCAYDRSRPCRSTCGNRPKKCRGRVLIPARGRRKYTPIPQHSLALSVPPGGVVKSRVYLPYRLELSSCDIVLSLCVRLCFRPLPLFCIAANAEEAKNDVKGLFLLTDYPAVTLRPGSTSSINLKLQNYGLPPERLAPVGRRRARRLDRDPHRQRSAGRGGAACDQCQRVARAAARRAEGCSDRHHQPDRQRQGRRRSTPRCRSRSRSRPTCRRSSRSPRNCPNCAALRSRTSSFSSPSRTRAARRSW